MFKRCFVAAFLFFVFFAQVSDAGERLWDREPTLWEAAQEVTIKNLVPPNNPQPEGFFFSETAPNLCTRTLFASLWGPPEHMTVSLKKTDVWDRRGYYEDPLPLAAIERQIAEGASKIPEHYNSWYAYDFPCTKAVGQIIVTCPDLEGAGQPTAVRKCSDGTVAVEMKKGKSKARLTYLPMMGRNIVAIRGDFEGLTAPVSVRLYRHKDINGRITSTMGRIDSASAWKLKKEATPGWYVGYEYSKDIDPDIGPLDPPEAGQDGEFFWIRQRLPAEKTFPNGFEYVMVALIPDRQVAFDTIEGQKNLGTPPYLNAEHQKIVDTRAPGWLLVPKYGPIRDAVGSAATAQLPAMQNVKFDCLVAIVTSSDSSDPLTEAKRRLIQALSDGFDTLAAENSDWYKNLYERREEGRVFRGTKEFAKKQVPEVFRSWSQGHHDGACDPDPTRYEAAVPYTMLEQDWDPWHGLPCYDELYFTQLHVKNQGDRMNYYYKLCNLWLPACRENAQEVFGLSGAALQLGYLPPVLPDKFAHSNNTWEFCMDIPGMVMKVLWDGFDYGGSEKFLAETVYPPLRETAIFYSQYAKMGEDGYYHVIPTVSAEHWGWTKNFERNRDSTSALCMFRWVMERAAEASEILGVDADLRDGWREVASKMAPYPTWNTPEGPILTDVVGVDSTEKPYGWFAGLYPTLVGDDVNLDSPLEERELMLRTVKKVKCVLGHTVTPLLGEKEGFETEQLINSRSGRIHLFPAVPSDADVAFRGMRARGGFEANAEMIKGQVSYVSITSQRDVECSLMNPWPGGRVRIIDCEGKTVDHKVDTSNGECLVFDAKSMHSYEIQPLR